MRNDGTDLDELTADLFDLDARTTDGDLLAVDAITDNGCGTQPACLYPDPLLTEAVTVASGSARNAGRSGSAALTWRAYATRSRSRTTPHGVFTGVAPATFTGGPCLRLGGGHRTRTVPDPRWLNLLARSIISRAGGLSKATLTTSNLIAVRGDRCEVEPVMTDGSLRPATQSVRNTEVTAFVLDACRNGIPAARAAAELAQRWPGVAPRACDDLLRDLVDRGFLLHDLLPDDPRRDPLGHLLDRVPPGVPDLHRLERLRGLLIEADLHPPGNQRRLALLTEALTIGRDILACDRLLRVDTAADATVALPGTVAREAAQAAGVLWRISRAGDPLTDYHQRFLTRYGTARAVPLLDVLDPVIGLGPLPPDVTPIGTGPPDTRREEVLARLLADALARDATEIVLDEATVDRLTNRNPAPAPRTAEIYVRVLSAGGQDRRPVLAVSGGSQDALSTSGRFLPLLDEDEPAPIDDEDRCVLVAELAVRPRTDTAVTVAAQTGLATCRIPVGVPPRRGDLDLADLTVFSDGRRLLVWSRAHDRRVRPVLYSRIALPLLPPAAHLLAVAGHTGERPWHCWSWADITAPFTPAVRYRDTWLAPARWTLPQHLTATAADPDQWETSLAAWRSTVHPRLPDIVVTDDLDRELPLDLRRDDDRALLRRYVRRGLAAVTAPPGGDPATAAVLPGPHGDHLLEVVVSLDRTDPADPADLAPAATIAAPPVRDPADGGLYLPGGSWLSLAVQAPAACHEQILRSLAHLLPEISEEWDLWFWLRYADSRHGEQLRIRFRSDPQALYGRILPPLSRWAASLRRQRLSSGFCVEPYEREIERYGGPAAITTAEQFFDADSRFVLDVLSTTRQDDARLVTAALATSAIAERAGSRAVGCGRLDRDGHRRANALRAPVRAAAHDRRIPAGWETALDVFASQWPRNRSDAIAFDLIHLHCNRLTPGREDLVRALAADLLAARDHRTEGAR